MGFGRGKGAAGQRMVRQPPDAAGHFKIVADINLDMVSRNDPKKIGITPSPRHGEYNSLVPAAQATCKAEGMEVVFDADEFYGRTDSYNFSHKGIPVIFFFDGLHADYHRPTDDFEKADLEKAARVARAAYRLGWQIAQGHECPGRSRPSPATRASRPRPASDSQRTTAGAESRGGERRAITIKVRTLRLHSE